MKEGERGPFFPKLRVRIKDNNSSPHDKFHRFSSKFPDLKLRLICSLYFNTYVTHTVSLGYLCSHSHIANSNSLFINCTSITRYKRKQITFCFVVALRIEHRRRLKCKILRSFECCTLLSILEWMG